MTHLLDTNVCIDALRGHPAIVKSLLNFSPSRLAVSTITIYELFSGVERCRFPQQERTKVEKFLSALQVVSFDGEAATASAKIRSTLEDSGRRIGPYDLLIAGHALSLDLTLVTDNTREFSRIPALHLENWKTS